MLTLKVFNYETGEFRQEMLKTDDENTGEWVIGRASSCDIVLPSRIVSRVHGRILFQDGQYWFTDFGSTDGSRINNASVAINQQYALKLDDLIRIGEHVFVVEEITTFDGSSAASSHRNHLFQSWKEDINVQCIRVIQETEDTKTFCLAANPPIPFNYLPGQFVMLELEINGEKVNRCYSLSSSPSRPHTLAITVK